MDMENKDQVLPEEEAVLETSNDNVQEVCEECEEQCDGLELQVEEDAAQDESWTEDFTQEEPVKKKIPAWKIAAAAMAFVLVLCVLAVGILYGMGKRWEDFFPENDVNYRDSFTVSDEKAHENAAKGIAVVGDLTLTNDVLNIFYWSSVSQYYSSTENQYYGYLDLSVPLSEQACLLDEDMTWEQYFIQQALDAWHSYAALYMQAQHEGYRYSQEVLDQLAGLPEELKAYAQEEEMDSVDALVKRNWGAGSTEAGYLRYEELMTKTMTYFSGLYDENLPSDEEVEAFYTEHEAEFEQAGYGKDAGSQVDVRHILISIDSFQETTEQTETTEPVEEQSTTETTEAVEQEPTQEQWDACYAKAQEVYGMWQSGEATEDSFAALAQEYSEDPGSVSTGGLYEDVTPGYMVEAFNDWIMDPSRKSGDTDIVETEFGYHIMYYVSGEPLWQLAAANDLLAERMSEIMGAALEAYPMETDYKKIVLGAIDLGV